MTYQFMVWKKDQRKEHFVFNQNSLRVVYPPSHPFIHKPVTMAVKFYEGDGWELIYNGAWRGDYIDEYMEAMRKMYPKELPSDSADKQAP